MADLTSATTCLMPSILPPAVCLTNGCSRGSGLCWAQVSLHLPLPSSFWPLALAQHSAWSDLLAEGGAAPMNGWINKHPLGQDQPADCQVFYAGLYHHAHHRNNLVINSGGIIHCNCAQVSFYFCPICAREETGVLYMHSPMFYSKYRGKHGPIYRDNYLKICTRFQRQ